MSFSKNTHCEECITKRKYLKHCSVLSKPILWRWNKELAVSIARRMPFYVVRIIKGCACAKKRGRRKKGRERFKADQYTSYSSKGAMTEIGIWKSKSTMPPRASNSKELMVAGRKGVSWRGVEGRGRGEKRRAVSKSRGVEGGRVPQRLVVTQV